LRSGLHARLGGDFLTISCLGALGTAALVNTVQFYDLLARETVRAGIPIPLSLLIVAALGLTAAACLRPPRLNARPGNLISVLAVSLACVVCFPIAQMLCFGKTDYRRPADAVVVLGARVYADGRPSDALADRVRTACQLYRGGLASKLILSGGPGDGAVHETECMRRMALELGVKADDIWLDNAGWNTQATVRNTEAIFSRWQASRILVVSHFYHLPRIKLAYQRDGWEVYTVPAKESYLLRQMPYNMAREVAALWVYYLRPLARA
jgi:vancomycin permeability regulator SanA